MPTLRSRINKHSRSLHRWAALLSALPLGLVIATGLLLQLKKHADWVQPPTARAPAADDDDNAPPAPTISFQQILDAASAVPKAGINSWRDVDRLDVRPERAIVKVRARSRWEIQLDATNADVLHVAYRRSDLIESLHDGSFFGNFAKLGVFLPAAILLLGLWLTGLYLWVLPHLARRRSRARARARPNAA